MKKKQQNTPITVGFVALGCPKNMVDSEKMLASIVNHGMLITEDIENADVMVINTCGFIAPARQEAIDALTDAAKWKKKLPDRKIVAAGCLVQREGTNLFDEVKTIDAIVGLAHRDKIAEIIENLFKKPGRQIHIGGSNNFINDDSQRLLITPSHYAFLRISEGCSRRCSFCTIPDIRGNFRSKPMDMILKEASELVSSGVKELILIAQDSCNYGKDIGLKNGLVRLLEELEKLPGLCWLRIMYLYPANVDDELIEKIASSDKILNYVDIPIQHINNDILKAMKRTDTKEKTVSVIEKLRKAMPDVVIRTTVITGFPGETEVQFNELVEFIKWAKFDMLGCFAYCPEKNTPASNMPNQIADEIKHSRVDQIMLAQQSIAFEKAKGHIGQKLKVIVDAIGEEGFASGRYFGQAPDIDSLCLIENFKAEHGDIIAAEVIGTDEYDLIVKQL